MLRRSTRICLEVVIGLFAGTIILCGIAVWRLSTGPVALDFLTPHLEAAFNQPDSEITVEVGDTVLFWGGWPESLDLRARTIKIRDREGFTLASLPSIRVKLSLRALLQGKVAPTLVEAYGARLTLVRGTDGAIQIGGETEAAQRAPGTAGESAADALGRDDLAAILGQLLAEPDPTRPLSYLTTLRILGAELSLNDQKLLAVWQVPAADMELSRDGDGLALRLDFGVALGERRTEVKSDIRYRPAEGLWIVAGEVADFFPATLAEMIPDLAAFGGFKLPLDARLDAELSDRAGLTALSFDIVGGPGVLDLANVLATPRPIDGLVLKGSFDGAQQRLDIAEGEVRFHGGATPGPRLRLDGQAGLAGETIAVELAAELDRIEADALGLYWPEPVASGGRDWGLENIRSGVASDLRLRLSLDLPRRDPAAAVVRSAAAAFAYENLDVHFLRPIPPVTGVSGSASFDGATFTFVPTSGRLGETRVQSGEVQILGLDSTTHSMEMTLALSGPLESALRILDHERLDLITPLGIDPADVAGQSEATLSFRFPLIAKLTFDDMEVAAQARLAAVSARDILLGQDASEGSLALDLTKQGMTVTGPLRLGGVPLTMTWWEDFTGAQDPRRTLEAEVPRLEAEERVMFKVDLRPYLEGPVSTKLIAGFRRDDTTTIEAAANLQEAVLDLPFLKWRKDRGTAGETRFRLLLVDDEPRSIEIMDLRAGTLAAKGRATLDGSRVGFSAIDLDRLSYDRTRLEAVRVVRVDDGFEIAVGGGALDATVYLEGQESAGEGAPPAPDEGPKTPLRLTAAKLGALYFAEDRYLEQVDLAMVRSTVGWEQVAMRGLVPQTLRRTSRFGGSSIDNSVLTLDFRPDGAGSYDVKVETNDMGSVLNALNVLDTVVGGELEITGKSAGTALDTPVVGRMEARGYELVNAPAMASLLTVASLTGIRDLMNGDGIRFERLTGDFTFWENVLTTDLMRAYGPALGLTGKGDVNLRDDLIELEGTVVPAYTINRVLGAIPVLGWILVGGEGEGLLAVTYKMQGELDSPQVTVNPLAALAPGFLRGLFGFTSADAGEELDTEPSLYPTDRGR